MIDQPQLFDIHAPRANQQTVLTAEMLYTAWYQAYQEKIFEPYAYMGTPALRYPTWEQMQAEKRRGNSNARREIALYERMAELANVQMGSSGSVEVSA